jgi:uncharacterized protein
MWYVKTVPMVNPFIFHRPLEPSAEDSPLDRPVERELLVDLADGGQAVRLTAPRRYGKSTLLKAVAADVRDRLGFASAYVDFSRLISIEDAAGRIKLAYERGLDGALKRTWRSWAAEADVVVRAGPVSLAQRRSERASIEELHALLDFPLRLHEAHETRSLIVLDEFQDLLTADPNLDGVLRSHIQHHARAASYVFAGSHGGMLTALFADRRRPLFEQARSVRVGPLPGEALGRWIGDRFGSRGVAIAPEALRALLDLAAGHPQRAAMLAHFLYADSAQGGPADLPAFARARSAALVEAAEGLTATWDRLDRTHRQAAATVAAGHTRLLGRRALEFARIPKSSMAAARDAMLAQGDLLHVDGGGVQLSDPFLGAWILGDGRA